MVQTSKKKTKRAKPGTKGTGEYFRIELIPSDEFTTFRNDDVGDKGHLQRVAGKRADGSWDTQAWLVSKEDAEKKGSKLVPVSQDAKNLLEDLKKAPRHKVGDIFTISS